MNAAPTLGEAHYRRLFRDAAVAEAVLSRRDGVILQANRKAEALFGLPAGQLEGSVFSSHFAFPEAVERCLANCTVGGETRISADLALPEGGTVPVEITAALLSAGRTRLIHAVVHEAGDKRRIEERLLASAKLLNATRLAQARFLSDVPAPTIFSDLLEAILELTSSEFGLIAEILRNDDGVPYFKVKVVSRAFWKRMSREFYARNAPIGMEFYNLNSLLGSVVTGGKPVIVNSPPSGKFTLPPGHPPIRSFLGLPFFSSGKAVGMACLANRAGGYDEAAGDFLKPLLETCGSLFSGYRNNQWRKEAEAELRRQALVFENISDGVILTDQSGRIVDSNPAAAKKFGFSKFEMLGAPIDFISDAKYKQRLLPALQRSLKKEGRWSGELTITDRRGEERVFETVVVPLRASGEDEGTLVWLSRDVTEAKATRNRLDQRSREMDAILSLSPDGFVFIDRHRKITYLNPAFEKMTGLKGRTLIGQDAKKLDQALRDRAETFPSGCADHDGRECVIHLTAPRRRVLKRVTRHMRDKDGKLVGVVRYFRDVTYESEVDRMKSEFLSTAAHELRTPMASVFGFSELLLKRDFPQDKTREMIDIIHRQAGHLVTLLNELLDLARIEARAGKDFHIEAQDILPIIRNTLAELLVPGDSRRVDADLPARLPRAAVDAEKMQLTLTNVLSNAYKYSLGKGAIELSAKERNAGGKDWIGIAVRDHGIGMSPEQTARIFERFYRADASGKISGTGLGMALVKEVMDVFGGEVEIHSREGEGTEVVLWLPAAKEEEP